MKKQCPKCKTWNYSSSNFCTVCGTALRSSQEAQALPALDGKPSRRKVGLTVFGIPAGFVVACCALAALASVIGLLARTSPISPTQPPVSKVATREFATATQLVSIRGPTNTPALPSAPVIAATNTQPGNAAATETRAPSDTPEPTNTPRATNSPEPTETARPLPTLASVIVDVPRILARPVADLESLFGKGTDVLPVSVGEVDALPSGGESRTYVHGSYTFDVYFDPEGVSRGFQLTAGLVEQAYSLDMWTPLLDRFGFQVGEPPDIEAGAARRWYDFHGYEIVLFARGLDGPVWSVQVWKLR